MLKIHSFMSVQDDVAHETLFPIKDRGTEAGGEHSFDSQAETSRK